MPAAQGQARIAREATTSMSAPASTRPTGITILSILAGLGGVFGLFAGFVVMGLGVGRSSVGWARSSVWRSLAYARPEPGPRLGVLDPQAVGLAARRRPSPIFGIVLAVAAARSASNANIISTIICIGIDGAILYYLNQPGIKALFGRWPATSTARDSR